MKKLLLVLTVAFITSQVGAQTEKGNVMVGGEVLLLARSGNTTFTASPNIGYFFMDNVAGGAEFDIITGGGSTNWGIGPYLRAYFAGNPTGKMFAQAGIDLNGATGSKTSAGFAGRLGYATFLNRNVALEFAGRVITSTGSTLFGVGAGFQIHLGGPRRS